MKSGLITMTDKREGAEMTFKLQDLNHNPPLAGEKAEEQKASCKT